MAGMTGHNPMSFWTDMTQKNIDTWRQMMGLDPKNDDPTKLSSDFTIIIGK